MIYIIAPRRKEFGCGVCDHTEVLVRRLLETGIAVRTVNYDGRPLSSEINARPGDLVLLQLSIYGYSPRGVPNWLPKLLSRLRKAKVRVVTFFHELWVSWARITSSAFWLAPLQFSICRRILSCSDASIFNVEWGYDWAHKEGGEGVYYRTSFSNVGEPVRMPSWSERENRLVVFGNIAARTDIYRALKNHVQHDETALKGLEIIDIGSFGPQLDDFISPNGYFSRIALKVIVAGPLDSSAVSEILGCSKFGLFATPWNHAGKSSILASYRAHGVCPISIHPRNHIRARAKFAPKPDVHFALLNNMDLRTAQLSAVYAGIAAATRQSYKSSKSIADILVDELTRSVQIEAATS